MKVASCLHPIRILNPYTKEYIWTACGKCPECLKRKSLEWTERLTHERYCWRYCLFFTLTYDNDNLPILKPDSHKKYWYDLSHTHYHPEKGDVIIDREDILSKCKDRVSRIKLANWMDGQPNGIAYLSVGDAQRFIKRVRTTLYRTIKQQIKYDKEHNIKTSVSDKDYSLRYYLSGEYGETTNRPHYHGLFFFNSEFTASKIEEIISTCWTFGITNKSFVAESNASYVAGYVNCTYNLPQVLLHERIRPFAIYSKCPFIGSLCHSSKEVKEIFFSASPTFVVFDHKKSAFANVPLWRSYIRQLYPKISGFSGISHTDRVNLYRAFERYQKITDFPNFKQFVAYVEGRLPKVYVPSLYPNYCESIFRDEQDRNKQLGRIYSWYLVAMRVWSQSLSFGIPIRMYVSFIERFYNNCEKLKLKNQYEYEQQLADEKLDLDSAFALDLEFVYQIRDYELCDLSYEEILAIQSFGIDIEKFYSMDDSIRNSYRARFLPESCRQYRCLSVDSELWLSKHTKNKKKNDYLMAHPELGNVLWSTED